LRAERSAGRQQGARAAGGGAFAVRQRRMGGIGIVCQTCGAGPASAKAVVVCDPTWKVGRGCRPTRVIGTSAPTWEPGGSCMRAWVSANLTTKVPSVSRAWIAPWMALPSNGAISRAKACWRGSAACSAGRAGATGATLPTSSRGSIGPSDHDQTP